MFELNQRGQSQLSKERVKIRADSHFRDETANHSTVPSLACSLVLTWTNDGASSFHLCASCREQAKPPPACNHQGVHARWTNQHFSYTCCEARYSRWTNQHLSYTCCEARYSPGLQLHVISAVLYCVSCQSCPHLGVCACLIVAFWAALS